VRRSAVITQPLAGKLHQPSLQKSSFGVLRRERQRPPIRGRRLIDTAQAPQAVGAGRVGVLIVRQLPTLQNGIDQSQTGQGSSS
jgi:hypothetical protein